MHFGVIRYVAKASEITETYTMAITYEYNTHHSVPYTRIKYLLITSLLLEDRDCITFLCVFP